MGYSAEILLDSVNMDGDRLTTVLLTYPRYIHSEFMTHRALSRNTASSRAIPVSVSIQEVETDPVIPIFWALNTKGMVGGDELPPEAQEEAKAIWLEARDDVVRAAKALNKLKVYKAIANRLLETFKWVTVIASGTDDGWGNLFALRVAPDAQKEFQMIAGMLLDIYRTHVPELLRNGSWHIPLADPSDRIAWGATQDRLVRSVARCARVSYNRHLVETTLEEDKVRFEQLRDSGHWSAFEHQAMASPGIRSGNFVGWEQLRQMYPGQLRSMPMKT